MPIARAEKERCRKVLGYNTPFVHIGIKWKGTRIGLVIICQVIQGAMNGGALFAENFCGQPTFCMNVKGNFLLPKHVALIRLIKAIKEGSSGFVSG